MHQLYGKKLPKLLKLEKPKSASRINKFKDNQSIPQWSTDALEAVLEKDYIQGYPNGYFKPKLNITRAETISLLDRCLGTIYKEGSNELTSGTTLVEGNGIINRDGVSVKNYKIMGNLYITAGVEDGEVVLENVTVVGKTIVEGGGIDTVLLKNSNLGEVLVNKKNSQIRLLASGNTSVTDLTLESGAKLEETDITGTGFSNLQLSSKIPAHTSIELVGKFKNILLRSNKADIKLTSGTVEQLEIAKEASETKVNLKKDTIIQSLLINSPSQISGEGSIKAAKINCANVQIAQNPENITVAAGINATVGNKVITGTSDSATPGSGGGSPGGNSNATGNTGGSSNNNNNNNTNNNPKISALEYLDRQLLSVEFDRELTGLDKTDFSFDNGLEVSLAGFWGSNKKKVILKTTEIHHDLRYTLSYKGLTTDKSILLKPQVRGFVYRPDDLVLQPNEIDMVKVLAFYSGSMGSVVNVEHDGSFTIVGLKSGYYDIGTILTGAQNPYYYSVTQRVYVQEGALINSNVYLRKSSIVGLALNSDGTILNQPSRQYSPEV